MKTSTVSTILIAVLGVLALYYPQVEFYRVALAIVTTFLVGAVWLGVFILFLFVIAVDDVSALYSKHNPNKVMHNYAQTKWATIVAKLVAFTWMYDALGWHNTAGAYFVGIVALIAMILHIERKLGFGKKGE